MTLSAPHLRFTAWAKRVAERTFTPRKSGGVHSGAVLVRISVDEDGRATVQLKLPHSAHPEAADWPAAAGGSTSVQGPEQLGELAQELWHMLHEKANGW